MIIAGTGSRSYDNAPLEERLSVGDQLVEILKAKKPNMVISGMAEGFDHKLAVVALALHIPLWCAIPNHGYGSHYWGEKSLSGKNRTAEFNNIVGQATKVTYVMEQIHHSKALTYRGRHSNFWRNDFMVEQADEFVVYNPQSRGTAQCFGTIVSTGKPYTIIEGLES